MGERHSVLLVALLYSSFVFALPELPGDCVRLRNPLSKTRIAVISDLNSEYGSVAYEPRVQGAVRRIVELQPDLVLSTGDMVGGQWRNLAPSRLREMWESFRGLVTEPLFSAGIPFAVTPGNHDAAPGFAEDQKVFAEEWLDHLSRPKPYLLAGGEIEPDDLSHYPYYYSFRLHGVFFASLNATYVGMLPEVQKKWVFRRLDMNDDAPQKILFGHVPFQPVAQGRVTEAIFDENLERELVARGVQYYLNGHHHAYYPGVLASGLKQISSGALGVGQRKLIIFLEEFRCRC